MPKSFVKTALLFLALSSTVSLTVQADTWRNITLTEPPLEDYEFWEQPSMNQSSDLALLGYQGWSGFSDYLRENQFAGDELSPMVLEAGLWLFVLPNPAVWARNEWQRDILAQEDISSRSDARYFWSESTEGETYVRNVADDDLARLAEESPGNFTRLGTARYEASHQLLGELSEANFFNDSQPRYRINKAYLVFSDLISLNRCRNSDHDLPGNESAQDQDIVGYDCRHWAYQLHRGADQDYADRPGRYIAHDDLTEEERDYLDEAFYFSLLNFVDSHYFAERNSDEINRLSFQPTPFGRAFGWHHLRFQGDGGKLGWDIYWQQNRDTSFPAARISVLDLRLGSGSLTGRLAGWRQPEDLDFNTSSADEGWAIETSYSQPIMESIRLQGDWYYKTDGWYAGYASLEEGSGWRFGVDVRLF